MFWAKSNREASRLGDVGLVGDEPLFRALHPKTSKFDAAMQQPNTHISRSGGNSPSQKFADLPFRDAYKRECVFRLLAQALKETRKQAVQPLGRRRRSWLAREHQSSKATPTTEREDDPYAQVSLVRQVASAALCPFGCPSSIDWSMCGESRVRGEPQQSVDEAANDKIGVSGITEAHSTNAHVTERRRRG